MLAAPHPAAPLAAACFDLLLNVSLPAATGDSEYSADLVDGDTCAASQMITFPLTAVAIDRRSSDVSTHTGDGIVVEPLRRFTRGFLCRLNALNAALLDGSPVVQASSAEFTFHLSTRAPRPPRVWHVDHTRAADNSTAVFTVALTRGSTPTRLRPEASGSWASQQRCEATIDEESGFACAGNDVGAATYYPLHACHARPSTDDERFSTPRRDVAAVHVRWTPHAPPVEVLLQRWQQSHGCA